MSTFPGSNPARAAGVSVLAILLAACATTGQRSERMEPAMFTSETSSVHRDSDDLLTAGLGLDGLRNLAPPAFADPAHPTAAELRRRAIWHNWRGIADLVPGGGYGELFGSTADVPGREYSAYARLPGAHQPQRVLLQVPDSFDAKKRCVVVGAASGSRGVYGAIAVAGAWGLPKGCAVAYTDKGAGTDYFDLDAQQVARVDGTLGTVNQDEDLAFVPDAPVGASGVAFKHAHSQDNPEADWGRHVRQAAEFALHALNEALPDAAPFTFANTRVIAVGISNGGGAVLRAAELEGDWLDAVVAGEPNVYAAGVPGARSLYDYATEAALLMPCALLHLSDLPQPPLQAQVAQPWAARCASLKDAGQIEGADTAAQAKSAYDRMIAGGWTEDSLRAGVLSAGFDLWRSVAMTYASAYGRYGVNAHPCGYRFSAQNADGSPRAATAEERAAWWSDGSGIPPGNGIGLLDPKMAPPDFTFAGLQCLRALNDGDSADARRVRKGIDEIRAGVPRKGLPVVVVQGTDDGLVPIAFSSRPWVAQARAAGRDVRYWQVRNVQHFDAFLGFPDYAARYLPLLPYVYAALDRVDAHLDGKGKLPEDAVIDTVPRGQGKPLEMRNLALPR